MLKNKKAQKGMSPFAWIVIALVAAFIFIPSFNATVKDWFSGTSTPSTGVGITDSSSCPTSGVTTYTLNVQDELATTATNVDTEYYVFNGASLIKEGTTGSDGTTSFDVACGKNYKTLLLNSTVGSGSGGYYAKIVDMNARISQETVNTEIVSVGGARIVRMINPNYVDTGSDANTNMTLSAGQSKSFQIQFEANGTNRGYQNPIILCQGNISSISTIDLSSFSDGTPVKDVTQPSRISASTGYRYYAWEYGALLKSTSGAVVASGSITATSTAPATADTIACKIVDQQHWKTSGYKTATSPEQAFMFGPENTETLADVGGTDSSTASILIGAEAN